MRVFLADELEAAPTDRLAAAFLRHGAVDAGARTLGAYDTVLGALGDPESRATLAALSSPEDAAGSELFDGLRRSAADLQAGLATLLFDADRAAVRRHAGIRGVLEVSRMRYRYLFEQMVRRELRQKYKGSALGVLWYLINPLVLMGAYYLMFGVLFKVATPREHYPLFLLVGLVVWIFFSQAVLSAAPSLLDHGALVRKARFPRETIPASVVTVQLVTFLALLALLTPIDDRDPRDARAGAARCCRSSSLCLFAFVLGLALAVSVLHAYFRDVAPILSRGAAAVVLPLADLLPRTLPGERRRQRRRSFVLEWLNPVRRSSSRCATSLYGGVLPSARPSSSTSSSPRWSCAVVGRWSSSARARAASWRWALSDGVRPGEIVLETPRGRFSVRADRGRTLKEMLIGRRRAGGPRRSRRCATSRCASSRARPSGWSGATAPASPRRCACSRGSSR